MSAFSFPRNPIRFPFHTFRGALIQPFFWTLFFLSPVLGIFQLDVIHQRMLVWGHAYPFKPETLMWLPLGFFACVLMIAFASTLFGRLFCGWVCPHNTLTEWTRPVRMLIGLGKKPFFLKQWEKRYPVLKGINIGGSIIWGITITFLLSALILFYFVPVPWYLQHLQASSMPVIVWFSQGLVILIGLFMLYAGHDFCRSACPYGLAQSLSAYLSQKWSPMEIRYRGDENQSACKSCHACETACPVDIDPRKPENLMVGIGEGCFNCGECIDACKYVRGIQDLPGLLAFKVLPHRTEKQMVAHRELAE